VSCVRAKKKKIPVHDFKQASWLAEAQLDSQVGICSMEFIYGLFNVDASGRECSALRFPLQKPIVARPVGQDVLHLVGFPKYNWQMRNDPVVS